MENKVLQTLEFVLSHNPMHPDNLDFSMPEKKESSFRGNDCKYHDSSKHRCELWIKTGCETCSKFLKK